MTKIYWQIKRALGNKYQTVYILLPRSKRNKLERFKKYPSNQWGYGYWANRQRWSKS